MMAAIPLECEKCGYRWRKKVVTEVKMDLNVFIERMKGLYCPHCGTGYHMLLIGRASRGQTSRKGRYGGSTKRTSH